LVIYWLIFAARILPPAETSPPNHQTGTGIWFEQTINTPVFPEGKPEQRIVKRDRPMRIAITTPQFRV